MSRFDLALPFSLRYMSLLALSTRSTTSDVSAPPADLNTTTLCHLSSENPI